MLYKEQIFFPIKNEIDSLNEYYETILDHSEPKISRVLSEITLFEGKRLRPAMVFLSAGVVGNINHLTQLAAFGLELLHYASLLHDDVVDNGCKRHNKPTLNALWNNKIAVLTGDYLLSKCMNVIAEANYPKLLSKLITITNSMAYGELLQVSQFDNTFMNENEYMKIIHCKTASLISSCFEMGISSCISDEKTINLWKKLGEEIGVIFQLKDDLLDYQVNEHFQKDAHKDIKEHKITFPFIISMQHAPESEKKQLIDLYKNHTEKLSEIQTIICAVTEYEGINYTELLIEEKTNYCLDFINQQAENDYKKALLNLVQFIKNRNF